MQIDWPSEGGNGHWLTRSSLTPRISSRTIVPSVQGHPSPKERKYDTTTAASASMAAPPKLTEIVGAPGGGQTRSTESAMSVNRSAAVGPPKSSGRSSEIAKGAGGSRDGRGLFHPLKRRRQWLDSASSMVGEASVNGLSSATQWMERCDSMDGTSHFNGLTIARPSPAAKWRNRGGGRGDFYDAFCAFAFRPQTVRR